MSKTVILKEHLLSPLDQIILTYFHDGKYEVGTVTMSFSQSLIVTDIEDPRNININAEVIRFGLLFSIKEYMFIGIIYQNEQNVLKYSPFKGNSDKRKKIYTELRKNLDILSTFKFNSVRDIATMVLL